MTATNDMLLTVRGLCIEAQSGNRRTEIVHGIAEVEQHARVQGQSAAADVSSLGLSSRINGLANLSGLSPADQQNAASLRSQATQLAVCINRLRERTCSEESARDDNPGCEPAPEERFPDVESLDKGSV